MKKREQGLLTVEASMVLTFFTMFVLFLFGFARIYSAQGLVSHAVIQTADAVALESYLRETAFEGDAEDVLHLTSKLTESDSLSVDSFESLRTADVPKISKEKFITAIGKTEEEADAKLIGMGIKDGIAGIDFSECKMDLSKDDVIIAVSYTIKLQFPVFNKEEIQVTKTAKAKTFGEILFAVTSAPNNPGWGSTSGDNKVTHGSTVELIATPNYGYVFVSWDDGVTDNPRRITVDDTSHHIAIFKKDKFGVNLTVNNSNYGSVSGAGTYEYLDVATITATPSQHYDFAGWDDNGDGRVDNKQASRNITVDKTYNIKAIFTPKKYKITVKVNNSSYGSALVKQGSTSGNSITVEYGTNVDLIATAKSSKYKFKNWNDSDTQTKRNVSVTGNATYTANFELNTYTVTFKSNGNTVSTVQVIRGSSINGSNNYTGSKMPGNPSSSGKYFVRWEYGGSEFKSSTIVNKNIEVTAKFGTPSITLSGGASGNNSTTLKATTHPGGQAVKWSSSNGGVASVQNGVVTARYTGTAKITASFVYNGVTYSASKNVTIKPSIEMHYYCRRDGFNSKSPSKSTYGPDWWGQKNKGAMRFYYDYNPGPNNTDTRYGNIENNSVWHKTHDVTWSQICGAKTVAPRKMLTKSMIVHDTATTGPLAGKINPQIGYNAGTQSAYIFYDGIYDALWYIKAAHAPKPGGGYYDYYISNI